MRKIGYNLFLLNKKVKPKFGVNFLRILLFNFFSIKYCSVLKNVICLFVNGAHPALRLLRKCENLICVQAGVCRLQRLMEKPTSSR
jgi:hypothetical protein